MSESNPKANQKKPPNKNVKKLRTVSMVCSLAKSWQQWASENEERQASEPSGWTPSEEKREILNTKKYQQPLQQKTCSKENTGTKQTAVPDPAAGKLENTSESLPLDSKIRSKQVVKTVTSKVQEKGMNIGYLTDKYQKENEEVDKILNAKSSPTRRRRCSNLVSELTKGWKVMEKESKDSMGPTGPKRTDSMDTEDSGFSEGDEKMQEVTEMKDKQVEPDISPVRIKRPSVSVVNKDVDEAKRINIIAKKYSPVGNLKSKWQNWAEEHNVNQKLNPFSEEFDYELSMSTRLRKGDQGYGRPKEGSKTEERAKRAEAHIHREILDMCYIISTMADPDPDGKSRVTFGELFDRYVRISDKVVGILMRARKHGKVHFEGEMLWQGRDDHVIITLLV
ncbi:actin binding Rho activating protein b [Lepisosteus oculatus]|uniref:Actin-binding Rho-activating protein n=1 Tax=Lepisosteus oculatus TaxID=7918 RepID=W5M5W0_LEPOC|nr:PREDICTED: actin-binding Rho-activating protein [Lepisosteus oculatus]